MWADTRPRKEEILPVILIKSMVLAECIAQTLFPSL